MNSIYILKVQEALYRLYSFVYGDQTRPEFMNVGEYYEPSDEGLYASRRHDLLNRIENFLISMSHSFDQHVDEQLKQMRELKEQVCIIMQQMDVLKKKLVVATERGKSLESSGVPRRVSRLADLPEYFTDDELLSEYAETRSLLTTRNISF